MNYKNEDDYVATTARLKLNKQSTLLTVAHPASRLGAAAAVTPTAPVLKVFRMLYLSD